jgi:hypothetical protein
MPMRTRGHKSTAMTAEATGKPMGEAHEDLHITSEEFDEVGVEIARALTTSRSREAGSPGCHRGKKGRGDQPAAGLIAVHLRLRSETGCRARPTANAVAALLPRSWRGDASREARTKRRSLYG